VLNPKSPELMIEAAVAPSAPFVCPFGYPDVEKLLTKPVLRLVNTFACNCLSSVILTVLTFPIIAVAPPSPISFGTGL